MDEQKIKQIAQSVYDQNATSREFTVSNTSFHKHNGIDSSRISQNDIINGTTSIIEGYTISSETDTLNTLQNINLLTLHAIAANGLGQKALINGNAQLGKCYIYNWQGDVTNIPTIGGRYEDFLQSCGTTYLDATDTTTTIGGVTVVTSTGSTNNRVLATGDSLLGGYSNGYIAAVYSPSANVTLPPDLAYIQITKWTGTAITLKIFLAANWYIKWFLSMS